MPSAAPHLRSRSSVDELFALVECLDDDQIHVLLQDLNNTTTGNVAVAKGVDLFEHSRSKLRFNRPSFLSDQPPPQSPPPSSRTWPSPRRMLLPVRRHSRRVFSAPEPTPQRPKTASSSERSTRAYRRISRPAMPSPATGSDAQAILAAHLFNAPVPGYLSAPAAAAAAACSRSATELSCGRARNELDDLNADLLEPAPAPAPAGNRRLVFGGLDRLDRKVPVPQMDSIFQVLKLEPGS